MTKIELTISPDYVPSWTIADGIRELFQNALDQEAQCEGNTASWDYNPDTTILTIRNATSKLTAKTLLFGSTTKSDDSNTIGQFGEGYKVATLVLLRNNKDITFYNYGAREIWRPRFVNSRRFDAKTLTFFIDKQKIWDRVPNADLTIEVSGITPEEYRDLIVPTNLHLQDDIKSKIVMANDYGSVYEGPGRVYVNGLFVCDYAKYNYTYDFRPGQLKLDRDRKLVSDFDLRWLASKMWTMCKDENDKALAMSLLRQGAADVQFMNCVSCSTHNWSDEAAADFIATYGDRAVPVTCQEEADKLPKGYTSIIVGDAYKNLITASFHYRAGAMCAMEQPDKTKELSNWYKKVKKYIPQQHRSEFDTILTNLQKELK